MYYAKILTALDAEIDRLQRARNLLANSLFRRNKPFGTTVVAPKKDILFVKPQARLAVQSEQFLPPIQKLPYRERGPKRRHGRRSTNPAAPTALSSHVSAAPVAVPAKEVQRAKARAAEQERNMRLASAVAEQRSSGRSLGALIRALPPHQTLLDLKP